MYLAEAFRGFAASFYAFFGAERFTKRRIRPDGLIDALRNILTELLAGVADIVELLLDVRRRLRGRCES